MWVFYFHVNKHYSIGHPVVKISTVPLTSEHHIETYSYECSLSVTKVRERLAERIGTSD